MTGELKILDHTGDTTITWDPSKIEDVEAAGAAFFRARERGYLAYKVGSDGATLDGEAIRDFDPQARAIVMTPQMQGG